jgi:RNA polymerase sigma-70 factor (ECF subfamily)
MSAVASPRDTAGPPGACGLTQKELIQNVADGDQQALASLYDATSRTVYGLLLRILSDAGTAEEVLLDVYTQAWRQAASFDGGRGSPLAWLTTIARSRAIDRLRRGRAERRQTEPLDVIERSAASTDDVEGVVRERETRAFVRAALEELSPEQREVIELAYYGGFSHSEIAAAKGLPLGTVKTRTRLGMSRLRELLKTTYEGIL